MIKSKKGAEIALNLVIIAIIALLVLVIVVFIFSGKINVFSKGVSECASLGGVCEESSCMTLNPPRPAILSGECPVPEGNSKQYCCSKLG